MNGVDVAMNQAAFEWGAAPPTTSRQVQRAAGLPLPDDPAGARQKHRAAAPPSFRLTGCPLRRRYRARLEGIAMAEELARIWRNRR
jgi:hypothetical protein